MFQCCPTVVQVDDARRRSFGAGQPLFCYKEALNSPNRQVIGPRITAHAARSEPSLISPPSYARPLPDVPDVDFGVFCHAQQLGIVGGPAQPHDRRIRFQFSNDLTTTGIVERSPIEQSNLTVPTRKRHKLSVVTKLKVVDSAEPVLLDITPVPETTGIGAGHLTGLKIVGVVEGAGTGDED